MKKFGDNQESFYQITKHMNNYETDDAKKLRDRFAESAMKSLLNDPDNVQDIQTEGFGNIAWFAYKIADAMIKERGR